MIQSRIDLLFLSIDRDGPSNYQRTGFVFDTQGGVDR